jgi:hypothetical protein
MEEGVVTTQEVCHRVRDVTALLTTSYARNSFTEHVRKRFRRRWCSDIAWRSERGLVSALCLSAALVTTSYARNSFTEHVVWTERERERERGARSNELCPTTSSKELCVTALAAKLTAVTAKLQPPMAVAPNLQAPVSTPLPPKHCLPRMSEH